MGTEGWEAYDKKMGAEEREDLMVIRRRIQQAGTIMSPSEYKLAHPDPFWETWPGRQHSGR